MTSGRWIALLVIFLLDRVPEPLRAETPNHTVQEIAAACRPSIVIITFGGTETRRSGLGTGFVVAADGLIATNLHVLGEGRPIAVQTADGKHHAVTEIFASDRALDLAVIRIAAKELVPLSLGDSALLKEGQEVVAIGHPQGLTSSVVAGVVSGLREIENRRMIQLAIPIEPGNSGGPLLDMHGQVQGILTLKSAVTANLGFAMPINAIKPLLKSPNPISMERWLEIGALDSGLWHSVFDARWRRRAGKIVVDGAGAGFGGRALCLWQEAVPPVPFEVAVTVRLDDEAGAAGLAFDADGGDRHYGFYPSGGQLRLTRFNGPDVYSWTILSQQSSSAYRPGEWNHLKVRIENKRISCYVNDQLVVESSDRELPTGKVGLCKFRDTHAEFRNFKVADRIAAMGNNPRLNSDLDSATARLGKGELIPAELLAPLKADAMASRTGLMERARRLEKQAVLLRELAQEVHQKSVLDQLQKTLCVAEEKIDLVQAALLIARLDNQDLDTDVYAQELERMGRELRARTGKTGDDKAKLALLNTYFFTERGFHGCRSDYYNRANSYLSDVLDEREGLPITLGILYMELGRRIGLNLVGVGLPGHFVVEHIPTKGAGCLIDVFAGGKVLTEVEAKARVREATGTSPQADDFKPLHKPAIILRMLHNLLGTTRSDEDLQGALRYLDAIVAVAPDSGQDRWMRALGRMQAGNRPGALADAEWLLEHHPDDVDMERVTALHQLLLDARK